MKAVTYCAGIFEYNASVLRSIASASIYGATFEQVHIYMQDSPGNNRLVNLFDIPFSRFNSLSLLSAITKQEVASIHLINASFGCTLLASVAKLYGKKIVIDWDEWASRINAPWYRTVNWWLAEQVLMCLADLAVAASSHLRNRLIANGIGIKVLYAPYAMLPKRQQNSEPVNHDLQGPTVAYVGSFSVNYQNDMLELKNLARAVRKLNFSLLLIGDGPLLKDLLAAICREGLNVVTTGRLQPTDIDSWLSQPQVVASFLPLESTEQNLSRCPNKLFHYIQAGLPVVTNRVGEAAITLGDQGFYYDYGSEVSLEKSLEKAAIGRVSYDLKRYSWDASLTPVVNEVVDLIKFKPLIV
jgi:glycosyltransferase involved in cell wall biosynthesis